MNKFEFPMLYIQGIRIMISADRLCNAFLDLADAFG